MIALLDSFGIKEETETIYALIKVDHFEEMNNINGDHA